MSAYRYEKTVVDAERAEAGTVVLCGPARDSAVIARQGDWLVLTPGRGYELWPDTNFQMDFEPGSIRDQVRLEGMLRTCGLAAAREHAAA